MANADTQLPIRVALGSQTVLLRPFEERDAAMVVRNAAPASLWMSLRDRVPHPYTREDAHAWISFCHETYTTSMSREAGCWRVGKEPHALFLAIAVAGEEGEEDECVGSISLSPYTDIERVTMELGYYLSPTHAGGGLCTAATRAMTRFAFQVWPGWSSVAPGDEPQVDGTGGGLFRIEAFPKAHNGASRRVLEKCGFVLEGILRKRAVKGGRVEDMAMYSLIDEDL